jgi:hypothetical protein
VGPSESLSAEETTSWTTALRRATLALAVCLVVAGILFVLVEFGVIEGPGPPPGTPREYPTQLGYFFADERVIFPYQIAGGLLFSLGFLALAAIGMGLRSLAGRGYAIGTAVAACFSFAAGLLVTSQLIFIGAKRVAIDPELCDCRWATEQIISQHRALVMVDGVTNWLVAGTLLMGGLGMLAIPGIVARIPSLSAGWGRASQILGVVFLIGVVAIVFEIEILFQLVAAIGSVVLLSGWALWLGRQLARAPRVAEA